MKNSIKIFLLSLVALLGFSVSASAQSLIANTTLSAAVSDSKGQTLVVASATGISAPALTPQPLRTYLYIDREALQVTAVNGTTLTVSRGQLHTVAAPHVNAAPVFVMPSNLLALFSIIPNGSCTRGNEIALPRIEPVTGTVSDCLGGQWVQGDASQLTRNLFGGVLRFPDPGANALSGLETAGTAAGANTEIYCTELDLPYSMLVTGLAVLNGTTVGTNKHFLILYDSSGNVLANTAPAGTTTSGASTYQKINLVSKFYAVGPNRYFVCDGLNGTTDTIRHAATGISDSVLGGTVTAQVFGTAAKITVPTTFTTVKVPFMAVF